MHAVLVTLVDISVTIVSLIGNGISSLTTMTSLFLHKKFTWLDYGGDIPIYPRRYAPGSIHHPTEGRRPSRLVSS